jgi:hypothetical protein
MSVACIVCGAPATRWHHVTGRDARGRYLDPDFVVPLCHDDHELTHDDLRLLGVDKAGGPPGPGWTITEALEFALRRLGAGASRVAETHDWPLLDTLAGCLKRWADELRSHNAALDRHCPNWRLLADFYLAGA